MSKGTFKLTMYKGHDARPGHEHEEQFVVRCIGQGQDRLSPIHPDLHAFTASFEAFKDWAFTGSLCGNALMWVHTEVFHEQLNGEVLWEAEHAYNTGE